MKQLICKTCNSTDIEEYEHISAEQGGVGYKVRCNNCGKHLAEFENGEWKYNYENNNK